MSGRSDAALASIPGVYRPEGLIGSEAQFDPMEGMDQRG